MQTLTVIKSSNEIFDICQAYGLAYILQMNNIDFTIKQCKSKYTIITEDFDIEDLVFLDIDEEDINIQFINSTLHRGNIRSRLRDINKYFSENIKNVFSYYLTLDDKYIEKSEKPPAVNIGTIFYTLGIRATAKAQKLKLPDYQMHLAFIGYIATASYVKNNSIEINAILIPRETNELLRPYVFCGEDKETGEYKIWTEMSKLSDVEMIARVFLETHINHKYLQDNYEKIIFTTLIPTGNKPLAGKTFDLNISNWSSDLCYSLNFDLFSRSSTYDAKDALAKYIIDNRYINFNKLIKTYAIDGKLIDLKYKEELIGMYNDDIRKIYTNESVNKLARAFGRLSYDKKGFEIQSKLNSVANEMHIQDIIINLGDVYMRNYGYCILSDNEFKEVLGLINNKKDAKVIANAIMAGKVFVDFDAIKKNKEDK